MKILLSKSICFLLSGIFMTFILADSGQAQKVDLSTEEAVIAELGKQKNTDLSTAKICIERLAESTKIIVIGFFRYDAGCRLSGAFVDSVYSEKSADLSQKALNALGWKTANKKQREKLALIWVEKGLLAFSTVLYTKDKDFKEEFQPPKVVSKANGDVVVTLWTSVMKRKKEFNKLEFKFAADGNLLED